jgi:hypothetical protein
MAAKKRTNLTKDTLPVLVRYEGKGSPNRPDWDIADLVAIFPTEPHSNDPNTMVCYSVVGEHSSCHAGFAGSRTKPATPEQVAAMLKYLKGLEGYKNEKLRAVSRISSHHRAERVRQLRR